MLSHDLRLEHSNIYFSPNYSWIKCANNVKMVLSVIYWISEYSILRKLLSLHPPLKVGFS